jgi:hypothetical protein
VKARENSSCTRESPGDRRGSRGFSTGWSQRHTFVCGFDPFPKEKIEQSQIRNGQQKTDEKKRAVSGQLHSEERNREMTVFTDVLADEIKNQVPNKKAHVHHRVKDGEGDGSLGRGGVTAHGGHHHGGKEGLANRQGEKAAGEGQPAEIAESHDAAGNEADTGTKQERFAQPDGINERSDQDSGQGHQG